RVNVRARAEAKADILGQVRVGAQLTVVDDDGDWIGIAPPPQARAWVHGKFIRKVGAASAAKPPPKPVAKDGMDRGAGAVLLNKAAGLYREELAKPSDERKLDDVLAIYQKVASKCQDRRLAAQAEGARQRLLKILDLISAVKKASTSVKAFEDKYEKLEAEYKRRAQSSE
ncbi:SH3 domain-containing protein, partial [bacterium]|nr:SH3 domain-containing protein [bacterium]